MKYGFEKEWEAKVKAHGAAYEISKAVAIQSPKDPDKMLKNFEATYKRIFELVYGLLME